MSDENNPATPDNKSAGRSGPITPKSPRQAIQPERTPPPPRSRHARNPFVIVLNFFFFIGVMFVLAAGAGLYWGKSKYEERGPLETAQTVVIPKGTGSGRIATLLKNGGVIDRPIVFNGAIRLYGLADKLKAGEYRFEAGSSMSSVVAKLVEGKSILYNITFPEGLTSYQMVERLLKDETLVGEVQEVPTEGSLMPNTYSFNRGTTRQQIIDQMKTAQKRELERIWSRRVEGLPIKSPEELVILASIVEKETGKGAERPRVAGVFVNRLNKGMKLQTDPTVIYGIFGGKGKPSDRPIYRSDLQKETAYNTYIIPALPPGPIANPGRAAMEAVANPSRTDELFFVADGTGGHAFSKTLEEHNAAVAKWRKIEKERAERAKEQEGAESSTENAQ